MRRGPQHSGGIITCLLLQIESDNVLLRRFHDPFPWDEAPSAECTLLLDQEWHCSSCQQIRIILKSPHNLTSCSDHFYKHFLLLHAASRANSSLQSPAVPLSYDHACVGISGIVHHVYSISQRYSMCGISFCTPLGVFLCAPLRIAHCLDSLGKHPLAHF